MVQNLDILINDSEAIFFPSANTEYIIGVYKVFSTININCTSISVSLPKFSVTNSSYSPLVTNKSLEKITSQYLVNAFAQGK